MFNCDANTRYHLGRCLLHHACSEGNLELVRVLICNHNADNSVRDKHFNTPLHLAALCGNHDVVLVMIKEFGIDSAVRGHRGKTLLHSACCGGDVFLVKELILKHEADVFAFDNMCRLPIHVAMSCGKEKVVLLLVENFGVSPNISDMNRGKTLLHKACSIGNVNLVITLIIKHEADVNVKDNQNYTPLQVAVLHNKRDVAKALISKFVKGTSCCMLHVVLVMLTWLELYRGKKVLLAFWMITTTRLSMWQHCGVNMRQFIPCLITSYLFMGPLKCLLFTQKVTVVGLCCIVLA